MGDFADNPGGELFYDDRDGWRAAFKLLAGKVIRSHSSSDELTFDDARTPVPPELDPFVRACWPSIPSDDRDERRRVNARARQEAVDAGKCPDCLWSRDRCQCPSPDTIARVLQHVGPIAMARVIENGWGTDWQARTAYLTLEVSELVEAIRGKGDRPDPPGEAADVLFCVAALLHGFEVSPYAVARALEERCAPGYENRWAPDHGRA